MLSVDNISFHNNSERSEGYELRGPIRPYIKLDRRVQKYARVKIILRTSIVTTRPEKRHKGVYMMHVKMFLSGNFLLNLIVLVALLQLVNAISKEDSGQGGLMAALEKIYTMIMDYIKNMLGGAGGGAYANKAAAA
ncbi:hypothetical protein ISCGN_002235 [Ixodes scapularis]